MEPRRRPVARAKNNASSSRTQTHPPAVVRLIGRELSDLHLCDLIRLILNALKRIRAGIYGACLVCRSPIPYERLAVIPETRTCVRCRWDRAAV